MMPSTQPRKRRNSAKINVVISVGIHALAGFALIFFAAREGLLGKQLHKITVEMVKEKPPEKPKELDKPKPEEPPKVEPPKTEMARAPKPEEFHPAAPPASVAVNAAPMAAPPPTDLPSLVFDGGKTVQTSSDPVQLYKGGLEYAFRAHWTRPGGAKDDDYVDEVEISVNHNGEISAPTFSKSTGDAAWDASVLAAIASVKSIGRPPPTNFPARVTVRFDLADTEPISE